MAVHHGSEGLVKIGSNSLVSVTSWSYDQSADTTEVTALGDTEKSYKTGLQDGSGSLDCYWDETDTNGQLALEDAMANDTAITLNIYPEGSDSGDTYYSGTVKIESLSMSGSTTDIVTASFSYKGFLDRSTVA